MDNIYLTLFKTFFKIGAFTLGGGYAMIPIIEEEVVNKHKWAVLRWISSCVMLVSVHWWR